MINPRPARGRRRRSAKPPRRCRRGLLPRPTGTASALGRMDVVRQLLPFGYPAGRYNRLPAVATGNTPSAATAAARELALALLPPARAARPPAPRQECHGVPRYTLCPTPTAGPSTNTPTTPRHLPAQHPRISRSTTSHPQTSRTTSHPGPAGVSTSAREPRRPRGKEGEEGGGEWVVMPPAGALRLRDGRGLVRRVRECRGGGGSFHPACQPEGSELRR